MCASTGEALVIDTNLQYMLPLRDEVVGHIVLEMFSFLPMGRSRFRALSLTFYFAENINIISGIMLNVDYSRK